MFELSLALLPAKRFFRGLGRLSELSWLLLGAVVVLLGLISYGAFAFGRSNPEQLAVVINYFLILSLATGLWLGFARVTGARPTAWRLVGRSAWFYTELSRGLGLFVITTAITAVSFGVGAAVANGLGWWPTTLLGLLLLLGLSGVTIYNSALGLLIKIVTQQAVGRLVLLVALTIGSLMVLIKLAPLVTAFANNWATVTSGSLLVTALLVTGLLGVAIAVAELISPYHPIKITAERRYWALRLPTSSLGGFGAGTAIFVSEIAYYLRNTRIARRLIAGIAILAVGLMTLNLFTASYRANAETLFYATIALVLGFLALTIALASGRSAEARVEKYQQWAVSPNKIRSAFLAAALAVMALVAVVIIELFAASVLSTTQIVLLAETTLLTSVVAFTYGQASWLLEKGLNDPLMNEVLRAAVSLLVVILSGILLFFQGVVTPLVTGLTLVVWAGGAWLVAERQRQKALNQNN